MKKRGTLTVLKISLYHEPKDFDTKVRQAGNNWLLNNPNKKSSEYPSYWTKCLPQLASAYKNICCYYCIYIEPSSGAGTVDHYYPKKSYKNLVYEWSNFRYACLMANRRKGRYSDVIDPVNIPVNNTFKIDFSSGEVYYDKPFLRFELLDSTIARLKLNSHDLCQMRMQHLTSYFRGNFSKEYLKEMSPFVYHEAVRQGLL